MSIHHLPNNPPVITKYTVILILLMWPQLTISLCPSTIHLQIHYISKLSANGDGLLMLTSMSIVNFYLFLQGRNIFEDFFIRLYVLLEWEGCSCNFWNVPAYAARRLKQTNQRHCWWLCWDLEKFMRIWPLKFWTLLCIGILLFEVIRDGAVILVLRIPIWLPFWRARSLGGKLGSDRTTNGFLGPDLGPATGLVFGFLN